MNKIRIFFSFSLQNQFNYIKNLFEKINSASRILWATSSWLLFSLFFVSFITNSLLFTSVQISQQKEKNVRAPLPLYLFLFQAIR